MKFMRSETRLRARYVERTQAELIRGLNEPTVQRELGERALTLLKMAKDVYVPNIRNGVISEPIKYRFSNSIPVMAARPGEEYWIDRSLATMNELQRQGYANFLRDKIETDYQPDDLAFETNMINRRLLDAAPFEAPPIKDSSLAEVRGVRVASDVIKLHGELEPRNFCVWGRPLVRLSMRSAHFPSSILLHELNHVNSFEDTPVLPIERVDYLAEYWRQEYECYSLSAQYHNAIINTGDEYPGLASSLGAGALKRSKAVVKSMTALVGNNSVHNPSHMTPDMLDYMSKLGYVA